MNKTVRVTYSGGFHNSAPITVHLKQDKNGYCHISDNQRKKLSNHFCGIKDCTCGGVKRAEVISLSESFILVD